MRIIAVINTNLFIDAIISALAFIQPCIFIIATENKNENEKKNEKKIGEKKNQFDKKSVRKMKVVMMSGFRMTTE